MAIERREMMQLNIIVAAFLGAVSLTTPAVFADPGPNTQNDARDLFKVFATHPSGLALLDADDDGDLDCMKAVRTNYDESGPSAEYVWILKGLNGHPMKNITVHFEKGDTPDKAVVTVDNAQDQKLEARAIYADFHSCAVLDIPYNSKPRCLLWVTEEAKDNIPSKCHEEFLKNCNTENIIYDKETCDQV
ncbi:uncharacterized protein LOC119178530 [Rhipicephalus microplus]|uniref:uncharacterized protein LOC119178530 n=1 Tax=Rhipicephalus microplus TaxID=6941 RepID=UPI003F6C9422